MATKSRNRDDNLPVAEGAQAILGNNAKSDSARRAERFALQAVSRLVLPKERVRHCLRSRREGHDVSIWRSLEHGKAHYKGLQTCGSVWHCPVCAAKVSERRRAELVAAISTWKAKGGSVLFLTLTNSHSRADTLQELLQGQRKALKRFWNDRASRNLWEGLSVEGSIKATEVTHGSSGWHPHYHVLLFVSQNWDNSELVAWQEKLAQRWQDCCRAAGLPLPDLVHGCTLQDGSQAARYASKWGIPEEMTRGHTKKARHGHSPFDLLREVLETGDCEAAALFKEYAEAFKGARQLFWSAGLRDRLAVETVTDEEIACGGEDPASHLVTLEIEEWRLILRSNARARVLEAAEEGPEVLSVFLRKLGDEAGGAARQGTAQPAPAAAPPAECLAAGESLLFDSLLQTN